MSATVLCGINFQLGAALKQTDETQDRWGEEGRQVRLNEDSQDGGTKHISGTGCWNEMNTGFHVALILCSRVLAF